MPSPLPPSLWSDTARRVAAVDRAARSSPGSASASVTCVFGDSRPTTRPPPRPRRRRSGESRTRGATAASRRWRPATRPGSAAPTPPPTPPRSPSPPTRPQAGSATAPAATIVPADDWQLSLAATPLTADPIGAPILLSGDDEVPQATATRSTPSSRRAWTSAGGTQAFVVGDVAAARAASSRARSPASDPADVADRSTCERAKITGVEDPAAHPGRQLRRTPALAMPAAAWAARSGDPILFADGDEVPAGHR